MKNEDSKIEKPCTIQNVSNSGLNKCIELFDALTDQERTMVMDKHCKGCGNKITNWICDKCH